MDTITIPAFYQLRGYGFDRVAADRVPVGAIALVDDTTVMRVAGYTTTQARMVGPDGDTITLPVGRVKPIIGTDERHQFDLGHGFGVWLRTGEVLLRFAASDWALCAGQSRTCRKPLADVIRCWNRRITDPMCRPGPWKLGEDPFGTDMRHADGTPCGQPRTAYSGGLEVTGSWPLPYCSKCKQYETLRTEQQAYGDSTTCTTPGCDYSSWYDIGD